jgi:hypothetical protein
MMAPTTKSLFNTRRKKQQQQRHRQQKQQQKHQKEQNCKIVWCLHLEDKPPGQKSKPYRGDLPSVLLSSSLTSDNVVKRVMVQKNNINCNNCYKDNDHDEHYVITKGTNIQSTVTKMEHPISTLSTRCVRGVERSFSGDSVISILRYSSVTDHTQTTNNGIKNPIANSNINRNGNHCERKQKNNISISSDHIDHSSSNNNNTTKAIRRSNSLLNFGMKNPHLAPVVAKIVRFDEKSNTIIRKGDTKTSASISPKDVWLSNTDFKQIHYSVEYTIQQYFYRIGQQQKLERQCSSSSSSITTTATRPITLWGRRQRSISIIDSDASDNEVVNADHDNDDDEELTQEDIVYSDINNNEWMYLRGLEQLTNTPEQTDELIRRDKLYRSGVVLLSATRQYQIKNFSCLNSTSNEFLSSDDLLLKFIAKYSHIDTKKALERASDDFLEAKLAYQQMNGSMKIKNGNNSAMTNNFVTPECIPTTTTKSLPTSILPKSMNTDSVARRRHRVSVAL